MTRSITRIAFLFALALGVALAGPRSPGAAESAAPLPEDATPEQVLDGFQTFWKNLKDYGCTMDTKVARGAKETISVLTFTWKRPGLFKSKVIKGDDEGSWVWREADMKIRAKAGGALSLIKITMKDDDPRLADVRGARLQDGDWGSMVGGFLKRGDQGWTFTRLPDETLKGTPCFVIQAEGKPDKMGETREVFYFAKADLSVRSRRLWEGAAQVDLTFYDDVKTNQGLTPEDLKP